jgi:hypothetical protein
MWGFDTQIPPYDLLQRTEICQTALPFFTMAIEGNETQTQLERTRKQILK